MIVTFEHEFNVIDLFWAQSHTPLLSVNFVSFFSPKTFVFIFHLNFVDCYIILKVDKHLTWFNILTFLISFLFIYFCLHHENYNLDIVHFLYPL